MCSYLEENLFVENNVTSEELQDCTNLFECLKWFSKIELCLLRYNATASFFIVENHWKKFFFKNKLRASDERFLRALSEILPGGLFCSIPIFGIVSFRTDSVDMRKFHDWHVLHVRKF